MKFFIIVSNFFKDPYSTIRYVILKRINNRLKKKFRYQYKIDSYLKNKSLFETQYYDLENLINLIKKIKPKYVLELGGGFSTIAMCYALDFNFKKYGIRGKLVSYDQSKHYLNLTKKILPPKFSKYVSFKFSTLKLKKFNNQYVSIFSKIIIKDYNFIYEDRFDHKKTRIGADILFLERKIKSNFSFVVDGHRFIVKFLIQNLKKKYFIETNKLFFRTNFINQIHK